MSIERVNNTKDYYEILGISKTATPEEIKLAFRNLAKVWHPDMNKSQGAEDKFKDIAAAYEVLSDQESKRRYDSGESVSSNEAQNKRTSEGVRYDEASLEEILEHVRTTLDGKLAAGAYASTISVPATILLPIKPDVKMEVMGLEMLAGLSLAIAGRVISAKNRR